MDDKAKARPSPLSLADNPQALAQAQKLIEIGLMTSALMHELKQPLAGIKGYAQLLRETADGLVGEKANQILAQVDRLEQLVAAQRRFLHQGGGERAQFDLRKVATEAVRLLEAKAKQLNARIELRQPPHEVLVEAVESELMQIVANLLANALDAVAFWASKRVVEVIVRAEGGGELAVADYGPGVPPEVQSKLFTPFFTTKGPEAGTGLGLYISRQLAESNGAALEPVPAAMLGSSARTAFRLRFGGGPAAQAAPRKSVLVVDDEEVVSSLLVSLLEPDGLEVVVVANGDAALQCVAQRAFDLVISDKNLPGASGLDVARAVRQHHPGTPVMLMTGYASVETAQEGLAIGVIDYLEKPFDDISEIRRRVRAALERSSPPAHAHRSGSHRVLVVEDRSTDAMKISEAVTLAGGTPVVVGTVADALAQLSGEGVSGVVLSLELKDRELSADTIRSLCRGASGALVTLCDTLSLEQTISAIRMGAAACLPRALASPLALSRELSRVFELQKGRGT